MTSKRIKLTLLQLAAVSVALSEAVLQFDCVSGSLDLHIVYRGVGYIIRESVIFIAMCT